LTRAAPRGGTLRIAANIAVTLVTDTIGVRGYWIECEKIG